MRTIDEWLRSEETSTPFTHCIACKLPLLEIAAPWLVNKDFSNKECVMEYAICLPCRDKVSNKISDDSKKAVRDFLETEISWDQRIADFSMEPDPAKRFSHCIACESSREEMTGYAISALYDSAGELDLGPLPLMICYDCSERMTENLSEKTKGLWEDFMENHFDGPPSMKHYPGLI